MRLSDISSSELKNIIEIITYEDSVDVDRIPIHIENIIATKRSRVDVPSLRRQETLAALGVSVSKSLMFIFRYFDGLDSEIHKIKYKNNIYEIQGIENVEERNLYFNVLGVIKD
mgnify:CR=1 FL=1